MNNALINMEVKLFLWDRDFNSFGPITRSGLLDHTVVLLSIFWGTFILFSTVVIVIFMFSIFNIHIRVIYHHITVLEYCEFDYILIFTIAFYIIICFYATSQHPFISAWRTFSISCKAALGVKNSCSLPVSGKIFLTPLFLKDNLTGWKMLGWQIFFF